MVLNAFIIVIFVFIFLSFSLSNTTKLTFQKTYAQANTDLTRYKIFNDFDHGVSIQYPSNWIMNNTQNGHVFTTFYFYGGHFILSINSNPSTLDLNNLLQDRIASYKSFPLFQNSHLLESGINYMLAGKTAYKIVDTFTSSTSGIKYILIDTGTIVGHSIYRITVAMKADQYFNYLPIINNMINSYQINNDTLNNDHQSLYNSNTSEVTSNSNGSQTLSTIPKGTIEYYCVQYHTFVQTIAPNCHDVFHGNLPQSALAPKVGCLLIRAVPIIQPELGPVVGIGTSIFCK